MSQSSSIEWTDATWNVVRGCAMVSPGCSRCYAMKQAHRFSGPGKAYEGLAELGPDGPRWNGSVVCVPEKLEEPLHWKKPRKVFVNSMADLFHADVPELFIDQVFLVMAACQKHTFQILTKRPERMLEYCGSPETAKRLIEYGTEIVKAVPEMQMRVGSIDSDTDGIVLKNVWLGVSVETQQYADERIPVLLQTPAAKRFVSYEPALSAVNFGKYLSLNCVRCGSTYLVGGHCSNMVCQGGWGENQTKLDWIIAGGESGPHARHVSIDWMRSVRDQCTAAGVPFFFKQWGGVQKKKAGRELDGRTWEEFPK